MDQSKQAVELNELVKRTVKQMETTVEQLDQISCWFSTPCGSLPQTNETSSKAHDEHLRRIVRPIRVMTVTDRREGGSLVILDDDPEFQLSPTLTKLLLWIVSDMQADGLPRYKTKDESKKRLGIENNHTLNQQVYRLRHVLDKNDRNPFLVDTFDSELRFLVREIVHNPVRKPR
jgi:hypothetical protein